MQVNINDMASAIHAGNVAKGFWPSDPTTRNVGEALMLIVSEVVEAQEGVGHESDKLPGVRAVHEEIADVAIRALDLAWGVFGPYSHPWVELFEESPGFAKLCDNIITDAAKALESHRAGDSAAAKNILYSMAAESIRFAGLDVVEAKLSYNAKRPFKHGKAY